MLIFPGYSIFICPRCFCWQGGLHDTLRLTLTLISITLPYCPCSRAVPLSFLSKMSETKPLATVLFLHNPLCSILRCTLSSRLVGNSACALFLQLRGILSVQVTSQSICLFCSLFSTQKPYQHFLPYEQ